MSNLIFSTRTRTRTAPADMYLTCQACALHLLGKAYYDVPAEREAVSRFLADVGMIDTDGARPWEANPGDVCGCCGYAFGPETNWSYYGALFPSAWCA